MGRHISVHHATTKYLSNSFVFNTKIEKEGLLRNSAPDLGAGGLRFKSGRPDQIFVSQEFTEATFGAAASWCNLGTIGKIPEAKQRSNLA